jgi:hypothetical protein
MAGLSADVRIPRPLAGGINPVRHAIGGATGH